MRRRRLQWRCHRKRRHIRHRLLPPRKSRPDSHKPFLPSVRRKRLLRPARRLRPQLLLRVILLYRAGPMRDFHLIRRRLPLPPLPNPGGWETSPRHFSRRMYWPPAPVKWRLHPTARRWFQANPQRISLCHLRLRPRLLPRVERDRELRVVSLKCFLRKMYWRKGLGRLRLRRAHPPREPGKSQFSGHRQPAPGNSTSGQG